jgi:hypothetical protein
MTHKKKKKTTTTTTTTTTQTSTLQLRIESKDCEFDWQTPTTFDQSPRPHRFPHFVQLMKHYKKSSFCQRKRLRNDTGLFDTN